MEGRRKIGAYIRIKGKKKNLRLFKIEERAAIAYLLAKSEEKLK